MSIVSPESFLDRHSRLSLRILNTDGGEVFFCSAQWALCELCGFKIVMSDQVDFRDKGQRTKDKRQRTKVKSRRSKV